ncbi:hypothetical protein HJC23_001350 [Cyclotella cryptica]|uniref:Smr domain-containing protein n=1 Tax=Cyclotella cryptica TaxID=29204 RepID=A0ABD3PP78_9STRA
MERHNATVLRLLQALQQTLTQFDACDSEFVDTLCTCWNESTDSNNLLLCKRFATLVEKNDRFTEYQKERIMDRIMEEITGASCFQINVINKTTGLKSAWWCHPITTFEAFLYPYVGASRNLRFQFKGRPLFISASGKKTMAQLGFQDNDVLYIEEIITLPFEKLAKKDKSWRYSGMSISDSKRPYTNAKVATKNEKAMAFSPQRVDIEDYAVKHSKMLTAILEEAEPIFKERRRRLNEMAIKNCTPKARRNQKMTVSNDIPGLSFSHGRESRGKAGKSVYPVLIGDRDHLFSSRKKSFHFGKPIQIIDLHGYSCQEAIQMLDNYLPKLLEYAMVSIPWVIPVDIVCGCGNQVLSEIVEQWIKRTCGVANRPKSYLTG